MALLTEEQIDALAVTLTEVPSVDGKRRAFEPVARLLGVRDDEMNAQYARIAAASSPARYMHNTSRIFTHKLTCRQQAMFCVAAHDFAL
jgi:hypothetical protein